MCLSWKTIRRFGWIVACVCLPFELVLAREPWPLSFVGEAADPRVTWGELDNGFRYALIPTDAHPGDVSVHLVAKVGGLNGEEDERGYADFVRRMAFQGGANIEGEILGETLEAIQLSEDPGEQSSLSYLQTDYAFDLKNSDFTKIETVLKFLADVSGGLSFDAADVDRQRPLLLEELRLRDSVEKKANKEVEIFKKPFYPAERLRFSEFEVENVRSATGEQLKAFWEKWYSVDRLCLIVAGDFDHAEVEALVEKEFGGLDPKVSDVEEFVFETVEQNGRFESKVTLFDRETVVVALTGKSFQWDMRTEEGYRNRFMANFALGMLERRVTERFGIDDNLGVFKGSNGRWYFELDLTRIDLEWRTLLKQMYQPVLSLSEFGFNEYELKVAKRRGRESILSSDFARHYETPRNLSWRLSSALRNGFAYETGELRKKRSLALVESFGLDELNEMYRRFVDPEGLRVSVLGPPSLSVEAKQVKKVAENYFNGALLADRERVAGGSEALEVIRDFGKAGRFQEILRENIWEYEVVKTRLVNNVCVNVVDTNRKGAGVFLQLKFGEGYSSDTVQQYSIQNMGLRALMKSRPERLDGIPFQEIVLRDGVRNCEYGVRSDHIYMSFQMGRPSGVRHSLSLVAELVGDVEYLKEEFDLDVKNHVRSQKWETPWNKAAARWDYDMSGEDSRIRVVDSTEHEGTFEYEPFHDWLIDSLQKGFCELTVVGELDIDETLEVISQTLGTLEERKVAASQFASFGRAKKSNYVYRESSGSESTVSRFYWHLDGGLNLRRQLAMFVVQKILDKELQQWTSDEFGISDSVSCYWRSVSGIPNSRGIGLQVKSKAADRRRLQRELPKFVESFLRNLDDEDRMFGFDAVKSDFNARLKEESGLLDLFENRHRYPEFFEELVSLGERMSIDDIRTELNELVSSVSAKQVVVGSFLPIDPDKSEKEEEKRKSRARL